MTKEDVRNELSRRGLPKYPFRFYEQSPYQKARYKPEFVESEAWINHQVITEEDFKVEDYRNSFFNMIAEEIKHYN